jgi:S1-C subfamily serine protease
MHHLLRLAFVVIVLTSCGANVVVHAEQAPSVATVNVEPQEVSNRTVVHVQGESCAALVIGGGVVIAPNLIVTNAHVIAGMKMVEVRFPGGELVPVEVVGFDANRDLGLLRIEQAGLVPAPFIRGETAATGLLVAVDTEGDRSERLFEVVRRILATGDNIYRAPGASRRALELQMHVNRGESGSGIFDEYANLLGVVFAGSRREDGRSYAVTSGEIQDFVDESALNPTPVGPCLQMPPPEPDE